MAFPRRWSLKKGPRSPRLARQSPWALGRWEIKDEIFASGFQTGTPPLVLDGSSLLGNSSIREIQKGKVGYVANAIKQALLLPKDMVDLRTMKKHEVFHSLKRDLAMVSISN